MTKFTAKSTEYEYAGLSFTIPKNYIYFVGIYASWVNSKPVGFVINNSDSEFSNSTVLFKYEGTPTISSYISQPREVDKTYHIWVKYEKAGENTISVFGCSYKVK